MVRELFVSITKFLAWLPPFLLAGCGYFIGGPDTWMRLLGLALGLGAGGLLSVWLTGLADLADTVWGDPSHDAILAERERQRNAYRDQDVVRMLERLRQKPKIEFKVLNQVRACMRQRYIEMSLTEHVTEEDVRGFAPVLYRDSVERRMEEFEHLYSLGVLDLAGVCCLLAAYHGEATCQMAKRLGVPEEVVCHLSEKAKEKVQQYLDGFFTSESVVLAPEHQSTIHPDLLLRDIYYILNHA